MQGSRKEGKKEERRKEGAKRRREGERKEGRERGESRGGKGKRKREHNSYIFANYLFSSEPITRPKG